MVNVGKYTIDGCYKNVWPKLTARLLSAKYKGAREPDYQLPNLQVSSDEGAPRLVGLYRGLDYPVIPGSSRYVKFLPFGR